LQRTEDLAPLFAGSGDEESRRWIAPVEHRFGTVEQTHQRLQITPGQLLPQQRDGLLPSARGRVFPRFGDGLVTQPGGQQNGPQPVERQILARVGGRLERTTNERHLAETNVEGVYPASPTAVGAGLSLAGLAGAELACQFEVPGSCLGDQ
jgi:hypothetical protein